ncbi:MAG: ABC transporter permease [Planctomycetota bacterium]
MRDAIYIYLRYVGVSLRSQMQYRASFVMLSFGHFVSCGVEALGVVAMFHRFGTIDGWTLPEVALFYGMIHIAMAFGESFGRGFDTCPALIKSGDFDRLLLRPRSTALQVAAREVQLMRVGRLTQGLIVLLIAANSLQVEWTLARVALLLFAIVGGACLFVGLFAVQAIMAFWTTESLELINTVTYGGTDTAQYPLSIYDQWFQRFFTFVVPLACVSYFPALAILGRHDEALGAPDPFLWIAPSIGVLFLVLMMQVWRLGVRHYRSTGS